MSRSQSRKRPIVCAVVGDTHCGSTVGLLPAGLEEGDREDGVALPEGGRVLPSDGQRWLWANWLRFWDTVDATVREVDGELWGIHGGDSREGGVATKQGSRTTQLVSADDEVQGYIVSRSHEPMRRRCKRIYMVSGTESHVGVGGDAAVARWFKAQRHADTSEWAPPEWLINPRKYGVLIQVRHAANLGGLPWTRHGAPTRLARQVFDEFADYAARTGGPLTYPRIALRFHQHRYGDSGPAQPTRAIFCPAWQLSTNWLNARKQTQLADIGGIILIIWPDGTFDVRAQIYTPSMGTVAT